MERIINFFLSKSKIILLILVFIILMGIFSVFRTKKYAYAPTDYPAAFITAVYPGASPEDVELKVTDKIEEKLKHVKGLKHTRSTSMESFCFIEIEMEDSDDLDKVMIDIQKAIDQVRDFPAELQGRPVMRELNEDNRPFFEIAVTGKADYALRRDYARSLEKKLLSSKHVSSITKAGYRRKEVRIIADQAKLRDRNVSIGEIIHAIQVRNFRMSAGDLVQDKLSKKYVIDSELASATEVGKVIIRSGYDHGKIIINDIAEIEDGFEEPGVLVRYRGEDSINLVLYKKPGSDIIDFVDKVKTDIDEFRKTLPEDIQVQVITDYSEEMASLLSIVTTNALVGFALVLLVLFLLLELRIAFWTAMGIPTSIFMAFILFPYFDITIHYISLVAIILVLGMLVDDAIIIAENIYRYREQGLGAREAAVLGVQEVVGPVVTTVLTTIIVFLPILGMSGTMGRIFSALPVVIILLLGSSLLEGLVFLPVHIAHMKVKRASGQKNIFFAKAEKIYRRIIDTAMKHSGKTICIFILVLLLSFVVLATGIKFDFMDSEDGLIGVVKFETEIGTPLEETAEMVRYIENEIKGISRKEITGFTTTIGSASPGANTFGLELRNSGYAGNIIIYFTPIESRKRTAGEIINDIHSNIYSNHPFQKLSAEVQAQGPPVGRAVNITIVHNDDAVREKAQSDLMAFLSTLDGVTNIENNQGQGKNKIDVVLDYKKIASVGLEPYAIANTIRAAFNGVIVSRAVWQGEETDIRLILNQASRHNALTINSLTVRNMRELTVMNKDGRLVPIGRLIKQIEKPDLLKLQHNDGDRSVTVQADVNSDIITSKEANARIRKDFLPSISSIAGMRIKVGGEEESVIESINEFFIALLLALLGIYFILAVLFNSYTQPLLVMIVIPFALPGVVFSFWTHQIAFGMAAMIGFLGLMGVVVNDSLVMISFLNTSTVKEGLSQQSIIDGAITRLRPILLTTITTAVGLFPMAYGIGGYSLFAAPMVMAVAWGLVFATFVTLVLIPVLYYRLGNMRKA